MTRGVLRACVAGLTAIWAVSSSAQDLVTVTFAWDLHPSHEGRVNWRVEANGSVQACTDVEVTVDDRRCAIRVPPGDYTFRLQGVAVLMLPGENDRRWRVAAVGQWSEPLTHEVIGPVVLRWSPGALGGP